MFVCGLRVTLCAHCVNTNPFIKEGLKSRVASPSRNRPLVCLPCYACDSYRSFLQCLRVKHYYHESICIMSYNFISSFVITMKP